MFEMNSFYSSWFDFSPSFFSLDGYLFYKLSELLKLVIQQLFQLIISATLSVQNSQLTPQKHFSSLFTRHFYSNVGSSGGKLLFESIALSENSTAL